MQRNQNRRLTSPTEAKAYTEAAKEIIDHILTNRNSACLWWLDEEIHRHRYGLTPEQETELIQKLTIKFPKEKSNG